MALQTTRIDEDRPLLILIVRDILSDGSEAFDVVIGEKVLEAVTEKDAEALAYGIVALVEKHTNNAAVVAHRER